MLKWQTVMGVVAGAGLTLVAVQGQQRTAKVQTLTALDYAQIQQLVARYSYALDTGADNGYAYADLFAADGAFGRVAGRDQLAATARPGGGHYPRGPKFVFHYTSNHVIEPSPEGATGKVYVVEIDAGERGRTASVIEDGGHYEDAYVKTPQGWRFKSRVFVKTEPGTPPAKPR
jgi:actinorhodin biosynthesis protein ActVIA